MKYAQNTADIKEGSAFKGTMSKGKNLWNIGFPVLTTHTVSHTVRGRLTLKDECLISVPFQAGRSANSK